MRALGFACGVDLNEVRMIQSSGRDGLVVKTGYKFGVRGERWLQRLDRHQAFENRLPRLVDGAHRTLTKTG